MRLKPLNSRKKKQSGSALVVAIFVIVVLGLLVSVLSQLVRTSSDSVVVEVLGNRAFMAAQAGLQRSMLELFPLSQQDAAGCAAVNTGEQDDIGKGLAQCHFTVSCNEFAYTARDTHYRLESVGECEAGTKTTTRKLAIEARSLQ